MAKVPTYTAEANIPAGGTGPQASPAAYAAPAKAMGQLGETIASVGMRTGLTILDIKQKEQENDDTFWANSQANELTQRFHKFYTENSDKETLPDDFLKFSESEISTASSSAPNQNAAKKLQRMIGDNVSSFYGSALSSSYKLKQQNRLTQIKTNAQTIGEPIVSGGIMLQDLAINSAQNRIAGEIDAINQLPYSETTKRSLRGAFYEELATKVSTVAPEFAIGLINTTDIDEDRKRTLRNQFDNYLEANNAALIYNYEDGPNGKSKELESIYLTGVPRQPPQQAELKAIYGEKKWQLKQAQFNELYRVANTVANEFNKVSDLPYDNQSVEIAKVLNPNDPEVYKKLVKKLQDSKEEQQKYIGTWMQKNNSKVRDAFATAYSAPIEERPAKLTAARALSLKYQGSPESELDPEANKYHRLPPLLHQVMSQSEAEEKSKKIRSMSDEALASYIDAFAIEYPDDDQRAIAYNNLITLPKDGISADIQFAQMITDRVKRVNVIGVMRNEKYVKEFSKEKDSEFDTALYEDERWKDFHSNIDPTFNPQRPLVRNFRDAVISYAKRISVKEGLNPKKAIGAAINDLISSDDGRSGPNYFTDSINGQKVMIQAARDDRGLKPKRTQEDITNIGEKMRFAINQIPIAQVQTENPDGSQIFSGSEIIFNEAEKRKFIESAIRSQAIWVTKPNGQGAQIYLKGRDRGRFPLRDKNGKIFEVDYDELLNAPLDPFSSGLVQGPIIPYGADKFQGQYMQFQPTGVTAQNVTRMATSPMPLPLPLTEQQKDFEINIMSEYWRNLRTAKPKAAK